MKKIIVLTFIFSLISNISQAKSLSLSEHTSPAPQQYSNNNDKKMKVIKSSDNSPFMQEFRRRVNASNKYTGALKGDLAAPVTSIDPLTQQKMLEAERAKKKKSIFGSMYNKALEKMGIEKKEDSYETSKQRGQIYTIQDKLDELKAARENRQNKFIEPDFNTVSVKLPNDNRSILVPANEHIPYFFSNIEIMANGSAEITETIIIISEAKIFKNGLSRFFAKKIMNRAGDTRNLEIKISNTKKEGITVPYKLTNTKNGTRLDIFQEEDLVAGVHQYEIKYIVNDMVSFYDEFDEFYWDITGSYWGLMVVRAGAAVHLPAGAEVLSQAAFAGNATTDIDVVVNEVNENEFVYMANGFLGFGQNLQLFISLGKGAVYPATLLEKISRLFDKIGSIFISLLALIVIIAYYHFKRIEIRKENKKIAIKIGNTLPKDITPAVMRAVKSKMIDETSFIASLINIEAKGVIDIKIEQDNVYLIKNNDSYAKLSVEEVAIMKKIFGNSETKFQISRDNNLKIKRALNEFSNIVKAKMKSQILKINIGYILFGIVIYLLSLGFISFTQSNVKFCLLTSILSGVSLLITAFLGVMIFNKNININVSKVMKKANRNAGLANIVKYVLLVIFAATSLYMLSLLNIETNFTTSVVIAIIPFVIAFYSSLFISPARGNKNMEAKITTYINYLKQKSDIAFSGDYIAKNIAYSIAIDEADGKTFKNKNMSEVVKVISKEIS